MGSCSLCTLGWDIQMVKQKRSLWEGMTLQPGHEIYITTSSSSSSLSCTMDVFMQPRC